MIEKTALPFDIETLYRDLFTPLFRYVFFRTHDYDVACDITQNSFLKFLSQKQQPTSAEHAHKTLFVIARNTLIDHWRSAAHRLTTVTDLDAQADYEASIEATLIAQEDCVFVHDILKTLSEREAEVITLRMSGDVSYTLIAEILDTTADNARQLHTRALQKLRTLVSDRNYV